MAQEDSPSISISTSASTATSVPAPAPAAAVATTTTPITTTTTASPAPEPEPTSTSTPTATATATPVPVPVSDASDVAVTSTTSTNSVPPPTASTSPLPHPPSATPTLTSTPTPSAETLSTATANASAIANANAPAPVTATGSAPAPALAPAPPPAPPAVAPTLPPQQNGDLRASSSPSMANNQPPGHPRSYPSPNNFSTAGMQPAQYAYHPQPNQPTGDPYRASPGAVPSLPSMKSLEHHHYPQGAPQHQPMPMPMPMPPNAGMAYYMAPGVQNPYMAQDMSSMRYALPPGHDPRLMRGPGGPKKEIKRRTKTGCLTCRKRRIKSKSAFRDRVKSVRPKPAAAPVVPAAAEVRLAPAPAPAAAGRSNVPFLQNGTWNRPSAPSRLSLPAFRSLPLAYSQQELVSLQTQPRPAPTNQPSLPSLAPFPIIIHLNFKLSYLIIPAIKWPYLTFTEDSTISHSTPNCLCDEAHPTCNNCKKSKRECLGYDPIFKQQPGPSAIQPAPNAPQRISTPTIPSVPSSVPPTVPTVPSTPVAPPQVPVSSSNPYGNQSAVLPSSYNASVASSHAPLDPALNSAAPNVKAEPNYDFAASIDPALQNLPPATLPSTHNQPFSAEQRAGFDNHLRATRMKIDELIGLLGPTAPTQEVALTSELLTEIVNIYREIYADGLQNFFESAWFSAKDAQGKHALEHNQAILGQFASFVTVLRTVPANDHPQMTHTGVLEARLIWALATLPCNSAPPTVNPNSKFLPPPEDLTEAANRVRVLEALLCGDFLPSNPLTPPVPDPNPHRQEEFEFWYNLAEFLRYHDPAKREEILGRLRLQLGGRENRDLIYSIAVTREISPRVELGFEKNIPQHLDESNDNNRLYVANKFIEQEAQVTGGTTNIIRRISEITIRSYINPGVNIGPRPGQS
ncbi:C6 finger domain-containing protein [Colletotrichum karsti]|uniref:C6 finger domain-containing protein n=1 Tax=Colletotrichum karsti TaxID=1095194 RepID=A0A9P6LIF7_9PEZI|nr:C6 finger domain-containing protein [Colletotrichum karsti]KAF9873660.1 C6 finger domain-containing protein [Colletotrichum karsti]